MCMYTLKAVSGVDPLSEESKPEGGGVEKVGEDLESSQWGYFASVGADRQKRAQKPVSGCWWIDSILL